jgi:hypothetical protein
MNASTAEHLRLLSIFHYVLAGVGALFSLLPGVYMAIGFAMVSGVFEGGAKYRGPPPQLGWIFVAVGAVMMALALGYVVLVAVAGRFLARRRSWTYCMVVAGLSCAFFPFGTALGVFTIITLSRPEVKAEFEAVRPTVPPPPPAAA